VTSSHVFTPSSDERGAKVVQSAQQPTTSWRTIDPARVRTSTAGKKEVVACCALPESLPLACHYFCYRCACASHSLEENCFRKLSASSSLSSSLTMQNQHVQRPLIDLRILTRIITALIYIKSITFLLLLLRHRRRRLRRGLSFNKDKKRRKKKSLFFFFCKLNIYVGLRKRSARMAK